MNWNIEDLAYKKNESVRYSSTGSSELIMIVAVMNMYGNLAFY